MIHQDSKLTIDDVGNKLGLTPQFLFDMADVASTQYSLFDLPKRSGGVRTICSPNNELKRLQRAILEELLWDFKMPGHVHGSVRGRSIATNARPHINKPLVITIDIKNFFGSIKVSLVRKIFVEQFGCDDKSADVLTALTTYGNFLPQGAPTSPTLANIAALPLDADIQAICAEQNLHCAYTRYIDDITISGDNKLALSLGSFYRSVARHGFAANADKLKVGRPSDRQKVTGVVVNKKLNAPKKLIRKLRQLLYYCEKFGIEDHCERSDLTPVEFLRDIYGLLGYVHMLQPELADEMKVKLLEIQSLQSVNIVDEEAAKFTLLRMAIRQEMNVTFIYKDSHRRAAPAEIFVDEDGITSLRAYQIYPEMRWERYNILSIQSLQVENYLS